jgi:hypothetical protein
VRETRAEQFASLQTTNLKTSRAWAIKGDASRALELPVSVTCKENIP